MAYIKHRKHLPHKHSVLKQTSAIGLMAMALPVAAQNAEPPKKPDGNPEVTLPAVRATGAADTGDYKADNVASPKFTQPLVDTPQTITVIKKEILQQQAATSLSEALRNTPGITMQMGENGNTTTGDSIFMRGFDTTNSIFVDGIRDLGAISRDVFNIEQIEVVKGPAGSDNGRGASSGYVTLVSKTAGLEAFNTGSISLGTANRVRLTADLNRPLDLGIPGSALRLNLMAQDYGVPGRDEVKNKRFGFAPSLAFGLNTPTRAYINYLYIDQKNLPDGGVAAYGLPSWVNAQGPAVDPSRFYGSTNDFENVKAHMFTARVEHNFSPTTVLRNTARLGSTEQEYLLTALIGTTFVPGAPETSTIARSRQLRRQTNQILTNQTNLSTEFATGSVEHSLSTGVEFTYERQNQANGSLLAGVTQVPANLYNPSVNDPFVNPVYTGAYTRGSTLSAAVYVFDTLKFNEQFMLNGGLRWEKFLTETNSATYTAATALLAQNAPASLNDSLLSWKLGAVFKPAKEGSIYANVSTVYQPPGGANFSLSNAAGNINNAGSEPQKGTNIELGTKWDLLDGKLAATAAIYRTENENEIINDATTGGTPMAVGKRRVQGIELGLVGQVTPALNVSAGFANMDPKIIRGSAANNGGVIVFSPKRTFSSWATYKLPMGLVLGGGVRYVDTVARSSNNVVASNLVSSEDYWVTDLMASYDVNKNVSIQLNLNNVFDKEYVSSINNGGSRYSPGPARNALVTANLKF